MAYRITGTVLAIGQPFIITSQKTGNTITKRDLVITVRLFDPHTGQPTEDNGNTPKLTFMGDRCRDLDQFKAGDIVTVDFDINGRTYEKDGRTEYFTEVRPFRVALNRQQQQMQPYQEQTCQQSMPQQYQQPPVQGYQQPYPQPYGQQPQQAATQPTQANTQDLPF